MEPFTHKDFFRELLQLREFMGSRQFWSLPVEKRELAKSGFIITYLNTQPADESIAGMFSSTLQEYDKREHMVAMLKA